MKNVNPIIQNIYFRKKRIGEGRNIKAVSAIGTGIGTGRFNGSEVITKSFGRKMKYKIPPISGMNVINP